LSHLKVELKVQAGMARDWRASGALACAGIACVALALVALSLPSEGEDRLRSAVHTDATLALEKSSRQGEFDWCLSKAQHGGCSDATVARWCAQLCQANDLDGTCLQSILEYAAELPRPDGVAARARAAPRPRRTRTRARAAPPAACSIQCSHIVPNSAARLGDAGLWGCFTGLYQSEALSCVDDAAAPAACFQPDMEARWVEADSALRALIATNGCDAAEPASWAPAHPRNVTEGCVDMLPWTSLPVALAHGRRSGPEYECEDYLTRGWCAGNELLDKSKGGRENNWPEEHCCDCGGGNLPAPTLPFSELCVESQMAVHLTLASYSRGAELVRLLPNHFKLVQEFHAASNATAMTRESLPADGFIATGNNACWLAFRGSQEDVDWSTNLISAVATDCLASNNRSIGQCGVGFYASYDALRTAGLVRKLAELHATARCPGGFRVVGHSLGGAVASIAAADLHTLSRDAAPADGLRLPALTAANFRVYTFGEPRSLRWYAADWFQTRVAKVRWSNWGDPIPASPPSSWGFKHWCVARGGARRGPTRARADWTGPRRDSPAVAPLPSPDCARARASAWLCRVASRGRRGASHEIRSDYFRKHSFKLVGQDHGASGLYLKNHGIAPYIERLAKTCAPA
jgi:hypothetical protein